MPDRRPERERSASRHPARTPSRERLAPAWLAGLGSDRIDAVLLVVIAVLAVLLGILGSNLAAKAAAQPPAAAPADLQPLPMPTPPVIKPVVWIIGDELAAGTGSTTWTARTAKQLDFERHLVAAAGLGYIHQAKVGAVRTTVGTAARELDPGTRIVVLMAGRADHAATSVELVGVAAHAIKIAETQAPDAKILVIGPAAPDVAPGTDVALDGERSALRSAARENKATFIDPIAERWLTSADVQADGVHLTAAGEKVVAAKMKPLLAAALKG